MKFENVKLIVLTGGPCGGKTSALQFLKQQYELKNYKVYTIPEIPTFLFENGATYPGTHINQKDELFIFELSLLRLQLELENSFIQLAKHQNQKCIILCDRGCLDLKAYMSNELWCQLLNELQLNEEELQERYDIVCNLVSSAIGAEDAYSTATNEFRTENLQEAVELELKSQNCWKNHSNRVIVSNSFESFQEKLQCLLNYVISQCS